LLSQAAPATGRFWLLLSQAAPSTGRFTPCLRKQRLPQAAYISCYFCPLLSQAVPYAGCVLSLALASSARYRPLYVFSS
jgi:hypothetical protein